MPSGRANSCRHSLPRSGVNTKRPRLPPLRKRTPLILHRFLVKREADEEEYEDDEEEASSLSFLLVLEVATPLPLLSSWDRRPHSVSQATPPPPPTTLSPPPPSTVARPRDRARSMRSGGEKGFDLGNGEKRDGGTVVISNGMRSNGRGKSFYSSDCATCKKDISKHDMLVHRLFQQCLDIA